MKTVLAIQRGVPGAPPRSERFDVAFEAGQSVLDGLRALRATQDPTLAFRYACINANACKECMMLIDGRVEYACTARLLEGEMTLAPLPKKALVRDPRDGNRAAGRAAVKAMCRRNCPSPASGRRKTR